MTISFLPNESDVHQLMQQALDEKVFPGAVLLAARDSEILLHRAWGVADLSSERPVTVDTVYDLASLTKPIAATTAIYGWHADRWTIYKPNPDWRAAARWPRRRA